MNTFRAFPTALAIVALFASGCGSGSGDGDSASAPNEARSQSFTFGEPADASDATRVIEIDAKDDFSYTPDALDVTANEVVTFRVSNLGKLDHEFTLGDEAVQREHEKEMEEMGDMGTGDDPNAISIGGGQTGELTWKFAGSGDVLMGCHVVGHYDGGMSGRISVADV